MKTKAAAFRESIGRRIGAQQLLANSCTLMLCLVYILPNVWAVRTMYYAVVLPLLALTVTRSELARIGRSPIFLSAAIYFLVFVIAAPFTTTVDVGAVLGHVRHAILVLSYIGLLAILGARDPGFAVRLFVAMGLTAAAVAAANIWVFYGGLPSLDRLPQRLEGIPGQTMYYNPNWIALLYGIPCVGAAAAAMHRDTSRLLAVLLAIASLVLFAAVVLAQSRGVLIGVLAGLGVVVLLMTSELGPVARHVVRAAAAVVVAVVAFVFLGTLLERGDSYRLTVWRLYVPYVEAHPWAGSGLTAILPIDDQHGFKTIHPHNIVYHSLLRGGVFAAAALAALLVQVGVQAVLAWWRNGSPLLPALVVASLVPFQFEFSTVGGTPVGWDWVTLWLPIGLVLGASLATAPKALARPGGAAIEPAAGG
ncbi:hypothetical protein CCR97_24740 [Rhodoplanes elegans]|uniref:O-antigen ligase-related domain-containing protein n=1 Tax=Rhodoplanes elegans TaxID=29408 RepID=A0A327KLH0_9BRAD|nr:O-antigen ligase family protein [Rhodoplanes elegans]MBK5961388.1 hypothetical protein [Rhodoplanes elegans]RAI36168.1 hypothetical protein CH338_18005 [Rhodoplanes elegans]